MKIKNILIGCLASLLLVGCAPDASSSESSTTIDEAELSNPELWSDKAKSEMKKALNGELLPYIELGEYEVVVDVNLREESIVHILQKDAEDEGLINTYSKYLEKAGYDFVTTTMNFKVFEKANKDKSKVQVSCGYFPGSEDLKPGFQINAGYIIPLEFTTTWTSEEKAIFNTHLHQQIPAMRLTNKHTVSYDAELEAVLVKDMYATSDMMDEYLALLIKEGYTKNGDDTGFATYDIRSNDDELYLISIDPYDYNKLGALGIELWIKRVKDIKVSTMWPKDEINEYFNNDKVIASIPGFTLATKYIYYHKDGMFSIKCLAKPDQFENYLNSFKSLGFTVSYNEAYKTYTVASSDQSVVLLIQYTNNAEYQELLVEIYKR